MTLDHPHQGIFGSQSLASGWNYRDNIIMNNSVHGISDHRPERRRGRKHDRDEKHLPAVHRHAGRPVQVTASPSRAAPGCNRTCTSANDAGGNYVAGANGLNIKSRRDPGGGHRRLDGLLHQPAPGRVLLRPAAGNGAGDALGLFRRQPIGAHQRFYDVIVGGAYPKIGPAATAWKTWYDPKNQIIS